MGDEMSSLTSDGTWSLVPPPEGKSALPVTWTYKLKRDGQGRPERYKAGLVAKGKHQEAGIDFDKTFAPVTKCDTFRALMAIAAAEDLKIHQLDVRTAFLQGEL
jgi:histone deacetylase 1/2